MRTVLYGLITSLILFSGSFARAENNAVKHTENTTVRVFHNGQDEVLAEFSIRPDWHISWSNPGDVGQPTTVRAENSAYEITAQSTPHARTLYEIMHEYIYEDKAYYALKIENMDAAELIFDFVECNDVCKPETLSFRLSDIPMTDSKKWHILKTRATKTFPQKITLTSSTIDNSVKLDVVSDTAIDFAPTIKDVIDENTVEIKPAGDGIAISWQANAPQQLKQALIITPEQSYLADIEYKDSLKILLYMMLLAFLGGIILNAMPCVFPILSLKIFALLNQSKQEIKPLKNAMLYISGVLLSFWLLTAILVMLKYGGEHIGWGFQLQSPWFVGAMAVLFFIMFLYVMEWLRFPALATQYIHKLAAVNEFATGFFAVLIASPCTGPFMGAAVGYAFTRNNTEIFAVFTALALGYALPYALIEMFPQKVRQLLPKPGMWMRKLQIVLAIPLLLTSVWLGTVLYAQIKSDDTIVSELNWQPYDAAKIAELNEQGENIFVEFTADWCLTCKFNQKIILNTERFANFAEQNKVHLFVADMTEHNPEYGAALNAYGRDSIPLYVYYHNGNYELLPLFFRVGSLPH